MARLTLISEVRNSAACSWAAFSAATAASVAALEGISSSRNC